MEPKRPIPTLNAQVLDIGATGFAHPQAVQAEEDRQGGMVVVEALGSE